MKFSIIVTSYNQLSFIRDAVESALVQRHKGAELIVVDDGSSDGSADILDQYGSAIQLVKFKCNRGAIAARNCGASLARGEFLVFLDGDDVLMPWSLDVYGQIIATRCPKLILGATRWTDDSIPSVENEKVPGEVEFVEYEQLLMKDRSVGLCASAYVVEREAFWKAGGWSPGIFHLDLQDLSTKLGCSGKVILICAPPTAFYRIHGGNTILDVGPFLKNIHVLMAKEREGEYPGGSEFQFRRHAWFGGLVVFWIKRALLAGLTKDAVHLAASGWTMILAGICLRSKAVFWGRRPIETLALRQTAFPYRT